MYIFIYNQYQRTISFPVSKKETNTRQELLRPKNLNVQNIYVNLTLHSENRNIIRQLYNISMYINYSFRKSNQRGPPIIIIRVA